jgi:hypothetical protein
MESKPIKNFKIDPGKGSAFAYETHPMMPKAHVNAIIVGARGMGKSVAMVNFVERMPYHRVLMISPTMHSNRDLMKRLKIDPDDIFDPDDDKVLDKITAKIDQEAEEYEDYLEELKKFNSFDKKLRSSNSLFSDGELLSFFKGGEFKKPTHKYGGQKPCLALVCDDILGSNLLTKGSRKLNHMVILHRHLGALKKAGGALGCSLYFLVQSYKTQSGSLTKSIRNNCTMMILFHTKSKKELEEIAEEVGAEVSKETFMKLIKAAHKDKHDFLMIDLHRKPEHPSAFRRNLDVFLIPPEDSDSD